MRPLLALFVRTIREHTRARATYLVRALIGLLLLLLLWSTHASQNWSGAPGRLFFTSLIVTNFVLATLAGLGICAGAIAEEKEEGTFGLLRMTDLNAVSVLLGKGTGRLAILFLFIAIQIPFSFLSVTLGGMSVRQILSAYTLLGSYLFFLANLALLFSVILSRVWRATGAAGLTIFGLCWLPWSLRKIVKFLSSMPNALEMVGFIDWMESAAEWSGSVNPAYHLWWMASGSYVGLAVAKSLLTHTLLGLGCFGLAWLLFERFATVDSAGGAISRRFSFRIPFIHPPRPRAQSVAWKDFHFALGGRLSFIIRLAIYPFVVAFFVWISPDWQTQSLQDIANTTWWTGWILFHMEATVLILCMWAPERWQLNLSSLLLTPLSLRRIQSEKLNAFLIALLPSLAVVIASLVIGGSAFIDALFPSYDYIGLRGATSYAWGNLEKYGTAAINLAFFLTLCLNLSLRLKWTALPAALGILFLLQIVLNLMMLFYNSIGFGAGGSTFSYDAYLMARITQLVLLGIASVFLCLNTQRNLVRLAAEA